MATLTPNYSFILPAVNDPADQDLWGGYLNENFESLDTLLASAGGDVSVPVGAGMDYWGTTAPSGWIFPYGQALNRTTYAALFAVMGTTYGAGDGSTTFNVPDKRGRASFGKDDMGGTSANRLTDQAGGFNGDMLGDSGGEETHTLSEAEVPASTVSITDWSGNQTQITGSQPGALIKTSAGTYGSRSFSTNGGGGAHNTLPPGIVCNYIIYAGV